MKFIRTIILLSIFGVALCSKDENCVWNYKCCVFRQVNGQVSCEKMCEPVILCQPSKEKITMDAEEIDPLAPIEIKAHACREGHQFQFGKCRKKIKQRRQK